MGCAQIPVAFRSTVVANAAECTAVANTIRPTVVAGAFVRAPLLVAPNPTSVPLAPSRAIFTNTICTGSVALSK